MIVVWSVVELFTSGDGCLDGWRAVHISDGCLEGWRTVHIW